MKNILVINAHPDDLELMAGGTVIKWISEGKKVQALTLTHGGWQGPDSKIVRTKEEALEEENIVAQHIGYKTENLQNQTLDLKFQDSYVVAVLERIEKYNIDTIVCPFKGDLHHDHEITARIAMAASRRVPNILMGQINYYLNEYFSPNVFVDISDTWEKKIEALQQYIGQWNRAGKDWYEFLDSTSKYYGKIIGVERAEGFYSKKLKL